MRDNPNPRIWRHAATAIDFSQVSAVGYAYLMAKHCSVIYFKSGKKMELVVSDYQAATSLADAFEAYQLGNR